jgi:hypothetical protein
MNSTEHSPQTPSESIEAHITARMRRAGRGSVWCAERCGDTLPRNAIDQALTRMTQRQILVRIAHGVYLYPIPHPLLGYAPAAVADVLEMYASIGVVPCIAAGATAAAYYGLAASDSTRYEYAALGVSRTLVTRWWTMHIRPIAARYIVGLHPQTAMIIQALRTIGHTDWQAEHTDVLRQHLSESARSIVSAEASLAPGWMRPVLRSISVPLSSP